MNMEQPFVKRGKLGTDCTWGLLTTIVYRRHDPNRLEKARMIACSSSKLETNSCKPARVGKLTEQLINLVLG